ncbi:MAG: DMT family transporter [Acidobacteriota bacterium]
MDIVFSVFMAATAYFFLSFGFVLQKKGIGWIGKNPGSDKDFYKNLAIWITGFILMNIYGVPSAVALKVLQPHIVASFAGWGIVVLVFFSNFFLKEKLNRSDYFYSMLIIAGIIFLTIFRDNSDQVQSVNSLSVIMFFLFPILLFVAGFYGKKSHWIRTVLFATVSGCAAGAMVVALKFLVAGYDYRVREYFSSPYLYLYIFAALLSFIALQFALKNGLMITTGPVQYTSNIIYPVIGSYFVFNQYLNVIQLFSIILIVMGVTKILKNRK